MRRAILALGLVGAVLFLGALVVSFTSPALVERGLREVLRIEVEKKVGEQLDGLADSRIVGFAQRALGRSDEQIEATREAIRKDAAARIVDTVTNMLEPDCPCRQRLKDYARGAQLEGLGRLVQLRDRLAGLIESAYASVSASLLHEFRIFTVSNGIAFALLALVAFVKKGARLQLLLPAIALVGAVAIAGGLCLFKQDWLHTIVFGDYLGWGYAAYLSAVASLLADILMNRARVTTQLANAALNVVGVAASAVPC